MSKQSSEYGYYVRHSSVTRFEDDYPMSANQARYVANNLRHLHDMAMQHRVNWLAASASEDVYAISDSITTTYSHMTTFIVPWTFDMYGYPACPVIKIGGKTNAGTFTVYAAMNPLEVPAGYANDSGTYMFAWTGSTTSATSEWIIDSNGHSQFTTQHRKYAGTAVNNDIVCTEHDGSKRNVQVFALRLSIYGVGSTSLTGTIEAVSLRETVY